MKTEETTYDLSRLSARLTGMSKVFCKMVQNVQDFIASIAPVLAELDINRYPNKHVVHLACYGKKPRTRKKNLNRIYKWLTEN